MHGGGRKEGWSRRSLGWEADWGLLGVARAEVTVFELRWPEVCLPVSLITQHKLCPKHMQGNRGPVVPEIRIPSSHLVREKDVHRCGPGRAA